MRKKLVLIVAALLLAAIVVLAWPAPADRGNGSFFRNSTYDFETLRVLNDVAVAGGDTGETLQAIDEIAAGDADSWYRAWSAAGERTLAVASHSADPHDQGNALLRAHTYFRSAEFFLPPDDPRRPEVFAKNIAAFYQGLDRLQVPYERITVPYGAHHLNAVYYPGPAGSEKRPLLVVVGGYDSTMEELYLSVGAAAFRHGYSVLTYEGPGQGSVLREQGLTMQPDWEKPNGAVLTTFLQGHARPPKIVLLGESLGGFLAPRAAAFDPRIDGVVAFDIWFDGYAVAARHVPGFIFWLHRHGHDALIDSLGRRNPDPGSRWATQNGQWVFGVRGLMPVLETFKSYNLEPVAANVKQDVLLFAGADDHFVPLDQLDKERAALTNARSVAAVSYDRISGGSLHCQIGAPSLWQSALFDWMNAKFPAQP